MQGAQVLDDPYRALVELTLPMFRIQQNISQILNFPEIIT